MYINPNVYIYIHYLICGPCKKIKIRNMLISHHPSPIAIWIPSERVPLIASKALLFLPESSGTWRSYAHWARWLQC